MVSIRNKKSRTTKIDIKTTRGRKLLQKELDSIKNEKGVEIDPKSIEDFEKVKGSINKKDDVMTIINLKVSKTFSWWVNRYKKSGKIAVLLGRDPSNPNSRPSFIS